MSDTAKRTDPPKRYRPGDPILARDLTKLVEFVSALDKRSVLAALDGGAWHRCRSEVDAPSFSVLGVKDVEIGYDGVTIVVEEVTQEHENLVANEEYPLFAGVTGYVKLINDRDLCLVNVYDPFVDLIDYRYDLVVYNKEVALPGYTWTATGTGTGTGSGSGTPAGTGGVTPSCDLWAMSPVSAEGRCYVQAGLNPRLLLFQSTGGVSGVEVYSNSTEFGRCHIADRETRVVDYSRTFLIDCRDMKPASIVFPLGSLPELHPFCTMMAEFYNGKYYAVTGGTDKVHGTSLGMSGNNVSFISSDYYGTEASLLARPMFGEEFPVGVGVFASVIGLELWALASDCASTSSGTGSGT